MLLSGGCSFCAPKSFTSIPDNQKPWLRQQEGQSLQRLREKRRASTFCSKAMRTSSSTLDHAIAFRTPRVVAFSFNRCSANEDDSAPTLCNNISRRIEISRAPMTSNAKSRAFTSTFATNHEKVHGLWLQIRRRVAAWMRGSRVVRSTLFGTTKVRRPEGSV